MGKLSNQQLREQSMRDFLNKVGISNDDVVVSSIEGLFSYQFKDELQATTFADQLVSLLAGEDEVYSPETVELQDILKEELSKATCSDKKNEGTHRQACELMLNLIQQQASDSEMIFKDGLVEFTLPNPSYVAMLKNLDYPNVSFTTDSKMLIDVRPYIQNQQHSVVFLKGLNSEAAPLVFLSTRALDSQNVIFKKEDLGEGKQRVTPFFFVPQSTAVPTYSFMLDMSGSMEHSLPELKNSVIKLATELFNHQPNARIQLNIFSNNVESRGEFSKSQLYDFKQKVNGLSIIGSTALYDAAADRLNYVKNISGNTHILLFTDGQEGGSTSYDVMRLLALLNKDFPEGTLSTIRNKFYLINYNTSCNDSLRQIVERFKSQVINTQSADFFEAMEDPQKLREWAATRDLFTSHLYVSENGGVASQDDVHTMVVDLSGQIAELKDKILNPGETLSIVITDGDGKEVVNGETQNIKPTPSSSYSPTMFSQTKGSDEKSTDEETPQCAIQ